MASATREIENNFRQFKDTITRLMRVWSQVFHGDTMIMALESVLRAPGGAYMLRAPAQGASWCSTHRERFPEKSMVWNKALIMASTFKPGAYSSKNRYLLHKAIEKPDEKTHYHVYMVDYLAVYYSLANSFQRLTDELEHEKQAGSTATHVCSLYQHEECISDRGGGLRKYMVAWQECYSPAGNSNLTLSKHDRNPPFCVHEKCKEINTSFATSTKSRLYSRRPRGDSLRCPNPEHDAIYHPRDARLKHPPRYCPAPGCTGMLIKNSSERKRCFNPQHEPPREGEVCLIADEKGIKCNSLLRPVLQCENVECRNRTGAVYLPDDERLRVNLCPVPGCAERVVSIVEYENPGGGTGAAVAGAATSSLGPASVAPGEAHAAVMDAGGAEILSRIAGLLQKAEEYLGRMRLLELRRLERLKEEGPSDRGEIPPPACFEMPPGPQVKHAVRDFHEEVSGVTNMEKRELGMEDAGYYDSYFLDDNDRQIDVEMADDDEASSGRMRNVTVSGEQLDVEKVLLVPTHIPFGNQAAYRRALAREELAFHAQAQSLLGGAGETVAAPAVHGGPSAGAGGWPEVQWSEKTTR